MKLPEYGRSLQKMVDYAVQIQDKDERNLAVKTIIDIMGMMYPYLRDINDFKHKLWDHIAIMSDFQLDIDYPYDPPKPETFSEKPQLVPYTQSNIKFRHYGKIMEQLIANTVNMEDENPAKSQHTDQLANQMKKAYLLWNKDAVEDEKIFDDLNALSNGKLSVSENFRLQDTAEIIKPQPKKKGKNINLPNPNRKHK